jgi:YesN/AraC family two-component response regulator
MAFAQVPDLIISDWMMPEMDGAAFCKQIKNDPRTDHIPFIMLTAKADDKDKLAVLKYGATDFLVKPFVKEELVAKVRNLSDQKRKLQDLLKRSLLTEVSLITASSAAEVFVAEAKAYVERNIASEDLSVETLASALTLSREQCYRKMLALTGLPPSTFIRKLRLQRAKQLLSAKVNTVSQVAYNTGFNNLSYFSKAFKEEFGVLPSDI